MKKIILLITALLLGFAAFAQAGLDGTWYCEQKENEKADSEEATGDISMVLAVTYRFSGSSFSMDMQGRIDMDLNGKDKNGKDMNAVFLIQIDGSNSGTMARIGDTITLTPASGQKPKVNVTTDVKGVPGGGLLKTMMVGPLKKEITSSLKETESYKIISLTEKELVLEDILTQKEINKGEKVERVTFTRK